MKKWLRSIERVESMKNPSCFKEENGKMHTFLEQEVKQNKFVAILKVTVTEKDHYKNPNNLTLQ